MEVWLLHGSPILSIGKLCNKIKRKTTKRFREVESRARLTLFRQDCAQVIQSVLNLRLKVKNTPPGKCLAL